MTNKSICLGGAAVLGIGLFTPVVTLPIIGNVNLFNNGTSVLALVLIALGALSAWLAVRERASDALWPGVAAALILVGHFAQLQYHLSVIRSTMAKSLEGNPFAGLAQGALSAVQVQWGWLVLTLGAGLIVYAAVQARKEANERLTEMSDTTAKAVAGASLLAVVIAVGWNWYTMPKAPTMPSANTTTSSASTSAATNPTTADGGPSPEAAAYIKHNLQLYDLKAKYYDSMLDGRVPGVDFKVKNLGGRTLNRVTVRVEFQDADGKSIAEEEYYPVIVTESGYGDDNKPLRPNYIWQNEAGKFYTAKSVPSEWAEGKAKASIVNIEFAK